MAISKPEIRNLKLDNAFTSLFFPNFKFQISNFIAKIKDQQSVNYIYVPLQYGGEQDSTGVWKLKWRAGALQPRKKAGKNTNADSDYEYALAA